MQREAKANVVPVRQRSQFSCMASSLAMCLRANGHEVTEDEVNAVMGARPMKGASWEQALACAQHYGCRATLTMPATVEQLKAWTDQGVPIMIAWNPEGRDWSHASVVYDVDDDGNVWVADPNIPDPSETVRVVPRADFYKKWFEKWPNYLVRRPACAIEREVSEIGTQIMPRASDDTSAFIPFSKAASKAPSDATKVPGTKYWVSKEPSKGPIRGQKPQFKIYNEHGGVVGGSPDRDKAVEKAKKMAASKLRWDMNAKEHGRPVWKAPSPNNDGEYVVQEYADNKIRWILRQPGSPSGTGHAGAFRSWERAAKDAEDHANSKGRWRGRTAAGVTVKKLPNGDVVVNAGPAYKRSTLMLLEKAGWDRRLIRDQWGSWILPKKTVASVDEVVRALSGVDAELRRAAKRVANAFRDRQAYEVFVDNKGYAHDDEGNSWFVGPQYAGYTGHPRGLPSPGRQRPTYRPRPAPSAPASLGPDAKKWLEILDALLAVRQDRFIQSIRDQVARGRGLSDAQLKAVRQNLYRNRMKDKADFFRTAAERVAEAHMARAKRKNKPLSLKDKMKIDRTKPKTRNEVQKALVERGSGGAGHHHTRDRDVEKGRSRKPKQDWDKESGYKGNPGGEDIYPYEIDHGYDEPLAGGTDVMRRLQNQYLHEQGDVVPQRPESPKVARYNFDRASLGETARRVASDWLTRQEND